MRGFFERLLYTVCPTPFHIALTAAQPHFPDHYIFQRNRITTSDRDRIGTARLRGFYFDNPFARIEPFCAIDIGVPSDLDSDLLGRITPAPELHLAALPKHHVTAEHRRQPNLGPC